MRYHYRYRFYTNVQNLVCEPRGMNDVTYWRGYLSDDRVTLSYEGEVEVDSSLIVDAAEAAFEFLNRDDRPTGQTCPSASVGDVFVFETPDGDVGMCVDALGVSLCFAPKNIDERPYLDIVKEASR